MLKDENLPRPPMKADLSRSTEALPHDSFTRRTLRGLQAELQALPGRLRRHMPTRRRFTDHGLDIVKDENLPHVKEHPGEEGSVSSFP